jgi:hypothetical protein
MKPIRRSALLAVAVLLAASALPQRPAQAQFGGISVPGIDPKRVAIGAAAKQLGPYIVEQTPIKLDPVELYPRVDRLPGAPFAPASGLDQTKTANAIVEQLRHSSSGTVTLAPGDYAVSVRLYCMSHSRPGRAPLAFILGPMRGKRAPAVVAMNSRAAASSYQFSQIQITSWTIQGGLGFADFTSTPRSVVGALIPDFESSLSVSTLDEIQNKWSSLSNAIPGAPSLDDVLGQTGAAGQVVLELRDERAQLLGAASDYDSLRRSFAPFQTSDIAALPTPWSVVNQNVTMRMITQGHYGDLGSVQIRVIGPGNADVPLVSSLGYPRCQPNIVTQGSAYTCAQPLSFVPQKG